MFQSLKKLIRKILSVRIRYMPPDKQENWYFWLAFNPTSRGRQKGFFLEIFKRRFELMWLSKFRE
jgi:hypothetical protein